MVKLEELLLVKIEWQKKSTEKKGLGINLGKAKVMRFQMQASQVVVSGKRLCEVYKKYVRCKYA